MNDFVLDYIRTAQPVTTEELLHAARLDLFGADFKFTQTMVRQAVNSLSSHGQIRHTDDGWMLPRVEKPKTQKALF